MLMSVYYSSSSVISVCLFSNLASISAIAFSSVSMVAALRIFDCTSSTFAFHACPIRQSRQTVSFLPPLVPVRGVRLHQAVFPLAPPDSRREYRIHIGFIKQPRFSPSGIYIVRSKVNVFMN